MPRGQDEAEEAGRGDNRQPETGNAARDVRKEQMVQARVQKWASFL